jgi:hypothetical protein
MPEPRRWHPIMQAHEYQAGRWVLFDAHERPYALVDFIKRGPELGYRVTTWKQRQDERRVLGYYRTLAGGCLAAHQRWNARQTNHGAPNTMSLHADHDDPWR